MTCSIISRLGVNLPTVMKLVGHKRIEQTMEYVKLVNTDIGYELERVPSVV